MNTKKDGSYPEALRGEWAKPMKKKKEEQGKRSCRTALSKCLSSTERSLKENVQ
jgi:hypothetical protein